MSEMPQKRVCFLSAAHRTVPSALGTRTRSTVAAPRAHGPSLGMFAPVATRLGAARVTGDVGSSARRHARTTAFVSVRVGATRWDARRTPTASGVRTSRSGASSSRVARRGIATVARANAQANAPQVAPAHLRETVTPVPPEVLADGGMSLAEQPGMAAGFGDLTEHDFLRVNTDVPGLKVLHIDPPVVTVEGFLTADECDALIHAARDSGEMRTSEIGGAGAASADVRTSRTCTLNSDLLTDHPTKRAILNATELVLPQLRGLGGKKTAFKRPTSQSPFSYELPQVAHYRGGEFFKTHEDAFPANVAETKNYQRRATVLVYLNDVSEGGATRFEKLFPNGDGNPLDVRPEKGKALIFFPGTNASRPDPRTLHTAVEAVPGHEKWISQLWVCAFAGKHAPAGVPPGPGDRAARRAAEKEAKKAAKKAKGGGRKGGN